MRFRAELEDSQFMRDMLNMIQMLTKLARTCVMNIAEEQINFIANEESGTAAPLVWMDIDTKLHFKTFKMESANPQYPRIVLSIMTANLGRAFAQMRTHTARHIKFKLTNMQFPCLSIESHLISSSSENPLKVVHDVPVTVIPRSDWSYYELPQIPKCNIVLNMPFNRNIRSIIERNKNISPNIVFYAASNGELSLVCETDLATITTRCSCLEIIEQDKQSTSPKNIVESYCAVDCKKALLLVSALQVYMSEMAIGIDEDRLMHWQVNVRPGVAIHAILPALSSN